MADAAPKTSRSSAQAALFQGASAAFVAMFAYFTASLVPSLPSPFGTGMALTSAVQVLLPTPVFMAILGSRPVAAARSPSRLARLVPVGLVVLMMTAAVGKFLLNRC